MKIRANDPNKKNFDAYLGDRDELLKKHYGEHVAYCQGKRITINTSEDEAYKKAVNETEGGVILVQQIIPVEEEPIVRFRSPRLPKN